MNELPQLAELNKELADDVVIIGLNVDAVNAEGVPTDELKEVIKAATEGDNKDLPVVFSDMEMAKYIFNKQQAVPYTLFVDQDGNIVGKDYLGAKEKDEWKAIIDEEYGKLKGE